MNTITISTENLTISIESTDALKKPSEANITLDKMISVISAFNDVCETTKYTDEDISHLEESLNFKLGPKTKDMLKSVGNLKMKGFEVPDAKGIISLTHKWRNTVATDDQINRYIVIEADDDDFTLIDFKDDIFVYEAKKKETSSYNEDVITHITKHVMSKIVGDEYEY